MRGYTNEDNKKDRNRFKLLMEYDFYIGEDEVEDEENIEGDEAELEAEPEMDGEMGGEEAPEGDEFPEDPEATEGEPLPDEELEDLPEPEGMEEPLPEPEPMEDEVELDVTELVQGTEAAKESADAANSKVEALLAKFDNLTNHLEKMNSIQSKIDGLENEIEKRNPTPEEKLEMRSLDSYPYSVKLTDFWAEKEGNYDAMTGGKEEEGEKEYVLTQDEVESDYNAQEVRDSLRGAEDYKYNKGY